MRSFVVGAAAPRKHPLPCSSPLIPSTIAAISHWHCDLALLTQSITVAIRLKNNFRESVFHSQNTRNAKCLMPPLQELKWPLLCHTAKPEQIHHDLWLLRQRQLHCGRIWKLHLFKLLELIQKLHWTGHLSYKKRRSYILQYTVYFLYIGYIAQYTWKRVASLEFRLP